MKTEGEIINRFLKYKACVPIQCYIIRKKTCVYKKNPIFKPYFWPQNWTLGIRMYVDFNPLLFEMISRPSNELPVLKQNEWSKAVEPTSFFMKFQIFDKVVFSFLFFSFSTSKILNNLIFILFKGTNPWNIWWLRVSLKTMYIFEDFEKVD